MVLDGWRPVCHCCCLHDAITSDNVVYRRRHFGLHDDDLAFWMVALALNIEIPQTCVFT
jgi:hypothetical protein